MAFTNKRTPAFILLFCCSVALQGCWATMFSTSKQTVTVTSTEPGANVYLNGQLEGTTPTKIRVKRNTGGEVKVEKAGYKTHNEILYRHGANPLAYVDICMGVYPYYVDMATGAAYTLNKKAMTVDLVKLPDSIANSQSISCSSVKMKYKAGDKLGNVYVRGTPETILYFGQSVDANSETLQENANDILKDFGFKVPSSGNDAFSKSAVARYMVTADIKDISYNVHLSSTVASVARYYTVCEVNVEWKITSGIDNTKIERQTTGKSTIFENGGSTAFYDAFENSFYEFLQDKNIYTKLSEQNAAADSAMNFSYIRIQKPKLLEQSEKVINNAVASVVTVTLENGHGSGCILSADGYIVTNYHVVEGHQKVNVNFKSGISLQADVVRTNPDYDLALLKVTGSGFAPFVVSEEKETNIGADVFSIGTPADLSFGQTVSKGIVSGERVLADKKFIQTDVSISPGNSGGALVDKRGVLIGITNAKFVGTGVEGIGFAIPAYQVFDKLKIGY